MLGAHITAKHIPGDLGKVVRGSVHIRSRPLLQLKATLIRDSLCVIVGGSSIWVHWSDMHAPLPGTPQLQYRCMWVCNTYTWVDKPSCYLEQPRPSLLSDYKWDCKPSSKYVPTEAYEPPRYHPQLDVRLLPQDKLAIPSTHKSWKKTN